MKTLILLLGLYCIVSCNRNKEWVGETILIPRNIQIPLYQSIGGAIIDYTINDTIKENYPNIYIYKIEGNFAKVIVCVPFDDEISDKIGWIETKYLGTNLNNYSDITPIMSKPDEKSTVVFEIKDANWGDLYHVLDAHNKWLKIQNIYNPEEVGWLAPKYQCNDPYTTCN